MEVEERVADSVDEDSQTEEAYGAGRNSDDEEAQQIRAIEESKYVLLYRHLFVCLSQCVHFRRLQKLIQQKLQRS